MSMVIPTPRRALLEIDERQRRMASGAEGRVLDVSDHSVHSLAEVASSGDRYDTVLSVLQISTAAEPEAMCATLAELLAADGRMLFLEPTAVVGVVGAVQHAMGPWMRRATGRRPDYDIPALIRAAGLSIGDCERFTVRALWPYRSFVEGVARHPFVAPEVSS